MERSVLLVDDNLAFARSLQILLEDERPCRVRVAPSMAEAIATLADTHIVDIVISDISMLAGEGARLWSKIRDRNTDVVLVLMTAHPALLSETDCQALGVRTVLLKPIDPETVLSFVDA